MARGAEPSVVRAISALRSSRDLLAALEPNRTSFFRKMGDSGLFRYLAALYDDDDDDDDDFPFSAVAADEEDGSGSMCLPPKPRTVLPSESKIGTISRPRNRSMRLEPSSSSSSSSSSRTSAPPPPSSSARVRFLPRGGSHPFGLVASPASTISSPVKPSPSSRSTRLPCPLLLLLVIPPPPPPPRRKKYASGAYPRAYVRTAPGRTPRPRRCARAAPASGRDARHLP